MAKKRCTKCQMERSTKRFGKDKDVCFNCLLGPYMIDTSRCTLCNVVLKFGENRYHSSTAKKCKKCLGEYNSDRARKSGLKESRVRYS